MGHRQREAELQRSLALLREFGHEDFMNSAVTEAPVIDSRLPAAHEEALVSNVMQPEGACDAPMPSVLISVDVDLGMSRARLCVAPWHTGADLDALVKAFLDEHRVRSMFAPVLVQYVQDIEKQAEAFP